MNIVTDVNEWLSIRKQLNSLTMGFVPTMGNLHAGHISLCNQSIRQNDITVVSIFVNPAQFNNKNDFDFYPRTIEQDIELLLKNNVDYLLLPRVDAMYPDQYQLKISETELSQELEGFHRPGHFDGMLTIVLKLLNLAQPQRAYFGEKDFQQYLLVKKMVEALFLPIDIIPCETVRAEDGLALSSRNLRLDHQQRLNAAHFPNLLKSSLNPEAISQQLTSLGFKVDYIVEKWQRRLGAVWLGEVRLIDNFLIM